MLALFLATLIPIWIGSLLLGIVALLLMITSFGFGYQLALTHIFLEINVESAPPGEHYIQQFSIERNPKDRLKATLNHSLPYQTPHIIDGIAIWLGSVWNTAHAHR